MSHEPVLICIPAYNAGATLERTLKSIQDQTYANFRVIVVDNRSTDQTVQIATRFAESDDRFSCVVAEEGGTAEDNFNRCIALAQGEYTALFHSDDEYLPEMLENQVRVFRQNPDVAVVFTKGIDIDDNGEKLRDRSCPASIHNVYNGKLDFKSALGLILEYGNFFICPSAMFRSSVLRDKVKKWDGSRFKSSADLDVWLRTMQFGSSYIIDKALIRYRVGASSFTYHYGFLRTESADIIRVLDAYYAEWRNELGPMDEMNYKFQLYKDKVNQAVSHLILHERGVARKKALDGLGFKLFLHAITRNHQFKIVLIGMGVAMLSWFPLKKSVVDFVARVRFGR